MKRLDDDAPPVGRMRLAAHVATPLEAVDDASDGAGGESGQLGEAARRRGAVLVQQAETLPLSRAHTQVGGDGFVKEDDRSAELAAQEIGRGSLVGRRIFACHISYI